MYIICNKENISNNEINSELNRLHKKIHNSQNFILQSYKSLSDSIDLLNKEFKEKKDKYEYIKKFKKLQDKYYKNRENILNETQLNILKIKYNKLLQTKVKIIKNTDLLKNVLNKLLQEAENFLKDLANINPKYKDLDISLNDLKKIKEALDYNSAEDIGGIFASLRKNFNELWNKYDMDLIDPIKWYYYLHIVFQLSEELEYSIIISE